ncbi:cupin domain-containing protein [Sphingosinicella rhizophila]|uniref:Cupin domain-containing protein n=1 Tax=Sphingosinicella rhizophila TaxID=3050082 RepID=A0ABU3QAD9_9SPHN|nr:cupin domain-containing protein [Sphingosinicella sp. GR2756]MDT9600378.1 cupin domain-containing protein [Sphingosinicella sp. GR2756]
MTSAAKAIAYKWDDVELEQMSGTITRRFVHSDDLMIAQITLPKGNLVPAHRHHNEQVTYMITGALRFLFGEDQDEEVVVRAGEVLFIPSNLLHSAEALEDTFELDVFNPPRQDWIDGSDAYLRSK